MNSHVLFNNFIQAQFGLTLSDVFNLRVAVADNVESEIERLQNYIEAFRKVHGDRLANEIAKMI